MSVLTIHSYIYKLSICVFRLLMQKKKPLSLMQKLRNGYTSSCSGLNSAIPLLLCTAKKLTNAVKIVYISTHRNRKKNLKAHLFFSWL